MKSNIKALLVFSILTITAHVSYSQSAPILLKNAQDDVAANKDSLAVINATEYLKLKPGKAPGLYARAEAYRKLKKYQLSYDDYSLIIKKEPKESEAYAGLALTELYMAKPQDAIKNCDQSIALEATSSSFVAYIYKSMAQDSTEDYTGERESFNQAMALIKDLKENKDGLKLKYKHFFAALTWVDIKVRNFKEALDNCTIALQMDQGNKGTPPNYYFNYLQGVTHFEVRDYPTALTDLQNSISKYDSLPEAFFCRGEVYRKQKQYQNAISDLTRAIKLNPKYYLAYAERGSCYDDEKKYDSALADYKKSIAIYKNDSLINREYRKIKVKDFESRRTTDPPVVKLNYPEYRKKELIIPYDKTVTYVDFQITDKSPIDSIIINDKPVAFDKNKLNPMINQPFNIENKKAITIRVVDIYKNRSQISANINRVDLFAKTDPRLEMSAIITAGNGENSPLKSAQIILTDKDGNAIDTVFTNATGTFKLKDLKPDSTYSVYVQNQDSAMTTVKSYLILDGTGKTITALLKKNGKFRLDIAPYDPALLSLLTMENTSITLETRGKLLLNRTSPIANAIIKLLSETAEPIGATTTNDLGTFALKTPSDKAGNKTLTLDTTGLKLSNGDTLFLADNNGSIHSSLVYNKLKATKLTMLRADRPYFTKIAAVDPWLKASKLSATDPEVTITEHIEYPPSEFKVTDQVASILDKAVDLLKNNSHLKIELSSHTDAKGNADSNLIISQKRAQTAVAYIISKGITAERISGEGYGEQRLLNKCTAGVVCTEEQQQQNRRTEFKIIYQ